MEKGEVADLENAFRLKLREVFDTTQILAGKGMTLTRIAAGGKVITIVLGAPQRLWL